VFAVHEPAAGIVLAAGESKRFGKPKQLLEWQGQTFVRAAASTALSAGLSPVIVVTGAGSDEVAGAVQGLPVTIRRNEDWQSGQSSSIIKGLESCPANTGSVVFLLADQPQIPPGVLSGLVELHASGLSPIVAPLVQGNRRGNPVLFDRVTFEALRRLSGDEGGRAVFDRFRVEYLPWNDERLLLDVDTRADYKRLKEMYGE
jgi:molybdenum cofactor cytidylyltransferase